MYSSSADGIFDDEEDVDEDDDAGYGTEEEEEEEEEVGSVDGSDSVLLELLVSMFRCLDRTRLRSGKMG